MKLTEIDKCRICGNTDLVLILDLGKQALTGRFPKKDDPDPPIAPLVLLKCNDSRNKEKCGLLQLKHTVSGEDMYQHYYGYRSGINEMMVRHLKEIAKEVEKKANLKEGDVVLDIGSNDATFLKAYSIKGIIKIGIDPTGEQFKEYYTSDIKLVNDFFTQENFRNVSPEKKAKIITSIAMFYDLPDPMAFVKNIKKSLAKDGIWVFEQSYIPVMLEMNSFDMIGHEHLEYYALKQIQWMLSRNELKIIDINFNDINGGSFKVTATHEDSGYKTNREAIEEAISKEHSLKLDTLDPFNEFRKRINRAKNQMTDFIKAEKAKGKKFYIYGASTKGNTLLQYYGIDNKMIIAAAERNPKKYGRRTPLTNIPIVSEAEARLNNPDYFLVLPWHFKEGFIRREKEFLKKGGKLLFPLPEFEIVGLEDLKS